LFGSGERENGERTGEKNGEGSGADIELADGAYLKREEGQGERQRRGKPRSFLFIFQDVNPMDPNMPTMALGGAITYYIRSITYSRI